MSLLSIAPDIVAAASETLENSGSVLRSANAAAASQTSSIAAPAADEVSAAITALFGAHAQEFGVLSAKAAAFHDEFVNLLSGGAAQYMSTELTNAQQTLVNTVNAPAQALLGHPLIGTGQGTAGAAAVNAADAIFPQGFNYSLGPLQVSATASGSVNNAGVVEAFGNATATLNSPFGSTVLYSGSAHAVNFGTGLAWGEVRTTFLGSSYGLFVESLNGSVIRQTYTFGGLSFSWPGVVLGILPDVRFSPDVQPGPGT